MSVGLHAVLLLAPLWATPALEAPEPLLVQFLFDEPEEDLAEAELEVDASAPSEKATETQSAVDPEQSNDDALVEVDASRVEEDELEDDEEEEESDLVHVVADADQATDEPEESDRIAKVNLDAERETRAPVPMLAEGPDSPAMTGRSGTAGMRSPEVDRSKSSTTARRGERAEEQAPVEQDVPEQKQAAAGGSIGAEQPAEASGVRVEEANLAGGKEGQDDEGQGARKPNPPSAGTESPSIAEDTPSTVEAPEGWQPTVVFDPSLGMPAPNLIEDIDPEQTEVEDEQTDQAREPLQARAQGNEGQAEKRTLAMDSTVPAEADALADQDQQGAETPKTAPGWQGNSSLANTTLSSVAGDVEMEGRVASTQLTTPEEEVDVADVTAVTARQHPHAEYMDLIEGSIRSAWIEQMPVAYKAQGMQGTTTVRVVVDARGRVVEAEVVRNSGYPELDAVALGAIPKRLPKPPDGAANPTFVHQIDFRQTDRWAGGL